ncbi:MAG: glutathione-dependent disulfide-bond oxidoreductase [Cardiobacteriaceae bacterium]|nr:glutathione-dependent disulfide-bond oxidoreductase [Cardiobacteriaceae bacterium]
MNQHYTLPKVWDYEAIKSQDGGKFGGTNRPTAGARHEQILPKGDKLFQLYSLNTPNGLKVNILLEELRALGKPCAFDAYKIDIMKGDQFGTGFVAINPNSKIPALVDYSGDTPVNVFESGAILLYLAEKFTAFIPADIHQRTACLSWLMWQMGSAPFLGGGFGHFYVYAPYPQEYPINRYTMESKRQLDVLNQHLAKHEYMTDEYSIADMAIWPWYGQLVLGKLYGAAEFLSVHEYQNIIRWANAIASRKAVQNAIALELTPIN